MVHQLCHKPLIQRNRRFRPGCRDERRPFALSAVTIQRKLRNHQYLSRYILQRKIHFIVFIGKDPQSGTFFSQITAQLWSIPFGYPQQDQKSFSDFPYRFASNANRCLTDSLYDRSHESTALFTEDTPGIRLRLLIMVCSWFRSLMPMET